LPVIFHALFLLCDAKEKERRVGAALYQF